MMLSQQSIQKDKPTSLQMDIEPSPPVHSDFKLKLYCVGSAELNQFYIPYDQENRRQSKIRRPQCLSQMKEFLILNEDEPSKKTIIPNPLLKQCIVTVACGATHTLINTTSGKVFSMGSNDEFALGRDGQETIPMEVPFEVSIDQISAGDSHSMFLNSTNNLLFFCGAYRGINKGFLADKVRFPTLIPLESILIRRHIDSKIRKVVSGSNHTLVLIDDQVYIRGDVEYFASGRKILPRNKEKLDIGRFQNVGIKHIEDIWTGGMHCFVKAHGQTYYGWGNNAYGQLGIGNNQHQTFPVEIEFFEGMEIKQIAGGEHHSIFLTKQGDLYACGKNDNGQLGLGEDLEEDHEVHKESVKTKKGRSKKASPIKEEKVSEKKPDIEEQKKDSKQIEQQPPLEPQPEPSSPEKPRPQIVDFIWTPRKLQLENIKQVSSGPHFAYAVANQKSDNSLYSWGLSYNFVLINGSESNDKFEPYTILPKIINNEIVHEIKAGAQHTVFLATPNKDIKVERDKEKYNQHVVVKKGKIYSKVH